MIYTPRAEGPRLYKSRRHRTEVCNRLIPWSYHSNVLIIATNQFLISQCCMDTLGNELFIKEPTIATKSSFSLFSWPVLCLGRRTRLAPLATLALWIFYVLRLRPAAYRACLPGAPPFNFVASATAASPAVRPAHPTYRFSRSTTTANWRTISFLAHNRQPVARS